MAVSVTGLWWHKVQNADRTYVLRWQCNQNGEAIDDNWNVITGHPEKNPWWMKDLDHYEIHWMYATAIGNLWIEGGEGTYEYSVTSAFPWVVPSYTINAPDDAIIIQAFVAPVAAQVERTQGDKKWQEPAWNSTPNYIMWDTGSIKLDAPAVPNVEVTNQRARFEIDGITDTNVSLVQLFVYDKQMNCVSTVNAPVNREGQDSFGAGRDVVIASRVLDPGGPYRVRARAVNVLPNGTWRCCSEWSDYSSEFYTIPAVPKKLYTPRAESETSVLLQWDVNFDDSGKIRLDGAKTYDIRYVADKSSLIASSDQAKTVSGIEARAYHLSGLDTGHKYFFQVRATNEQGSSTWSNTATISLGEKPDAPTCWSSDTSVDFDDDAPVLYWTHNSKDGSKETAAQINVHLWQNGVELKDKEATVNHKDSTTTTTDDDKTIIYSYDGLNTKNYAAQTIILWRVRTAGVTGVYGPWSEFNRIYVYAQSNMTAELQELSYDASTKKTTRKAIVKNDKGYYVITKYPFYIYASVTPNNQKVVSYKFEIRANGPGYRMDPFADETGKRWKTIGVGRDAKMVYTSKNEVVFEKLVDNLTSDQRSANAMTLKVTPDMVNLNQATGVDNPGIMTQSTSSTGQITTKYQRMNYAITVYAYMSTGKTVSQTFSYVWFSPTYNAKQGDRLNYFVECRVAYDPNECVAYISPSAYSNASDTQYSFIYSIYRRSYDGTYVPVVENFDPNDSKERAVVVEDPHPSLSTMSYRVVAVDKDTGYIAYDDSQPTPVDGDCAIIQWNELWQSHSMKDTSDGLLLVHPSTSWVKLKGNLDVTYQTNPDTSLVEYAGRENPVSYYGTQNGEAIQIKCEVPKYDTETVYQVMRLSKWKGNAYVRVPSGIGFWAKVDVSYSLTHCELTVPVSVTATRVEGGA